MDDAAAYFDSWAHDALQATSSNPDYPEIYEGSDQSVTAFGYELRRLLASAYEAGWQQASETMRGRLP